MSVFQKKITPVCSNTGTETRPTSISKKITNKRCLCCLKLMKPPEKTMINNPTKTKRREDQASLVTRAAPQSHRVKKMILNTFSWDQRGAFEWARSAASVAALGSFQLRRNDQKTCPRTEGKKRKPRRAHLLSQQVNNQSRSHMWPRSLRAHRISWHEPSLLHETHAVYDLNINKAPFISYLLRNLLPLTELKHRTLIQFSWIAFSFTIFSY